MSHKKHTHHDQQNAPEHPADQTPAEPTAEAAAGETVSPESAAVDEALREQEVATIARLETELAEAKDRELRARAELENYKKRAAREMADERRYANLPLIRDLLPVLDNLHRAIDATEKNHDAASLLAGVKMVVQQFRDIFGRHHCHEIDAQNTPFDPHRHQAVCQQPSEDVPPNTVVNVVHAGFQLHDRVVRPSQVIVSTEVKKEE